MLLIFIITKGLNNKAIIRVIFKNHAKITISEKNYIT